MQLVKNLLLFLIFTFSVNNGVFAFRPEFSGGDGTLEGPYKIKSGQDLNSVRNYLDQHFILLNDINLESYSNWNPIGDCLNLFTGSFNGDGNTISNIHIHLTDSDGVGLFGYARSANISKLILEGVNITGKVRVGGLVGDTVTSTISEVSVEGEISGYTRVGGIIGNSDRSNILNSRSVVHLRGIDKINPRRHGGLVGNNRKGDIINSYSNSSISFASEHKDIGGVSGNNFLGNVTSSYYNVETFGYSTHPGRGTAKTHLELLDLCSYSTWDRESWYIVPNKYPSLKVSFMQESEKEYMREDYVYETLFKSYDEFLELGNLSLSAKTIDLSTQGNFSDILVNSSGGIPNYLAYLNTEEVEIVLNNFAFNETDVNVSLLNLSFEVDINNPGALTTPQINEILSKILINNSILNLSLFNATFEDFYPHIRKLISIPIMIQVKAGYEDQIQDLLLENNITFASKSTILNLSELGINEILCIRVREDDISKIMDLNSSILSLFNDEVNELTLYRSLPQIGIRYNNANQALWTSYPKVTGEGYNIAVLDVQFQISPDHKFYEDNVVQRECFTSGVRTKNICGRVTEHTQSYCSTFTCPSPSVCNSFHGSHVAGIAAGFNNNRRGNEPRRGVAQGAGLILIDVFHYNVLRNKFLTKISDTIRALKWIHDNKNQLNIAAVSMSLGRGLYSSNCDSYDPRSQIVTNLKNQGIAVIVASGNEASSIKISAPACISSAIAVGSVSSSDRVSSFSNSNSLIDFLAPGEYIRSSVDRNNFGYKWGTSMATPHVSGAWTLLKSAFPQATYDQIYTALSSKGVQVTDSKNSIAKPRIQVDRALNYLDDDLSLCSWFTFESGEGTSSNPYFYNSNDPNQVSEINDCPGKSFVALDCTRSYTPSSDFPEGNADGDSLYIEERINYSFRICQDRVFNSDLPLRAEITAPSTYSVRFQGQTYSNTASIAVNPQFGSDQSLVVNIRGTNGVSGLTDGNGFYCNQYGGSQIQDNLTLKIYDVNNNLVLSNAHMIHMCV